MNEREMMKLAESMEEFSVSDFTVEELENQIFSRMQNNAYIQSYCDYLNIDFPDVGENEEETQLGKVYKATIRAYAEIILGV